MEVNVRGLIRQLEDLENRLNNLKDRIEEKENDDDEENVITLSELEDYICWYDTLNIAIAVDGLKQAYLKEEGDKK